MKPPILFSSIDLTIWHGFRDITHIKVNKDRKSAILNMIKLNIFGAYLYLKPHISSYSNGLAIWNGL